MSADEIFKVLAGIVGQMALWKAKREAAGIRPDRGIVSGWANSLRKVADALDGKKV